MTNKPKGLSLIPSERFKKIMAELEESTTDSVKSIEPSATDLTNAIHLARLAELGLGIAPDEIVYRDRLYLGIPGEISSMFKLDTGRTMGGTPVISHTQDCGIYRRLG